MSPIASLAQAVRATFSLSLISFVACTGSVGNEAAQAGDNANGGGPGGGSNNGGSGSGAGGAGTTDEFNACGPLPQRLWRLTPLQLENVLQTLSTGTKDVA
jgi:hypothetical protein